MSFSTSLLYYLKISLLEMLIAVGNEHLKNMLVDDKNSGPYLYVSSFLLWELHFSSRFNLSFEMDPLLFWIPAS